MNKEEFEKEWKETNILCKTRKLSAIMSIHFGNVTIYADNFTYSDYGISTVVFYRNNYEIAEANIKEIKLVGLE